MTTAAELLDIVVGVMTTNPALHVRQGVTLDGGLSEADHDTATITVNPRADRGEARCALLAALLHLYHGPSADEAADNRRVEESVARFLVPRSCLPAILDTADPQVVAQEQHVDLPTARLGIALACAEEHPTEAH